MKEATPVLHKNPLIPAYKWNTDVHKLPLITTLTYPGPRAQLMSTGGNQHGSPTDLVRAKAGGLVSALQCLA